MENNLDLKGFKVGDKVIALPGYSTSDNGEFRGGSGYVSGKTYIIESFTTQGAIIWSTNGRGVWGRALQLVINYEIY